MANSFKIIKASGESVFFDAEKLKKSLQRSGADEISIQKILKEVGGSLYDGISTKEIYKKAFNLLKKTTQPSIAARYKLKNAIMELGPTGFPFEKFVAAVLNYEGYQTKVDVIVQGHCVSHEIDIIALKGNYHFMIECKFHNDAGRFCDVKIPLYIQSRFLDVDIQWKKDPKNVAKFHQEWVVTNTRFTTDAIEYANCMGLKLLSWDYPKGASLKERIDKAGLHPVTSLTTITLAEKQKLLDKGLVLCVDLCKHPEELISINIHKQRHKKILDEASDLCYSR